MVVFVVVVSDDLKTAIVDQHNRYRASMEAANMQKMVGLNLIYIYIDKITYSRNMHIVMNSSYFV